MASRNLDTDQKGIQSHHSVPIDGELVQEDIHLKVKEVVKKFTKLLWLHLKDETVLPMQVAQKCAP